jgi:hypothetical protein
MKLLTISFVFEKWLVLGNKNSMCNKLGSFIFWHCFPAICVQVYNIK